VTQRNNKVLCIDLRTGKAIHKRKWSSKDMQKSLVGGYFSDNDGFRIWTKQLKDSDDERPSSIHVIVQTYKI